MNFTKAERRKFHRLLDKLQARYLPPAKLRQLRRRRQGRAVMQGVFAACERRQRKHKAQAFNRAVQDLNHAIAMAWKGWGLLLERAAAAFRHVGNVMQAAQRHQFLAVLEQRSAQVGQA